MAGRHSIYTPEIASQICALLEEGQTLRQISRCHPELPVKSTVMKWRDDIPAFAVQYTAARARGIEALAEELLEIADDGTNDWIKRENRAGMVETVADTDHINRSRLRVDTRKWLLSKMRPDKYGDQVKVSGDPLAPLIPRVVVHLVDSPKPEVK